MSETDALPAPAIGEAPDLSVKNFAVCEVQRGMRLMGAAVNAPTAYFVLAGEMHMALPGLPAVTAHRGCLVLLPAGMKPAIAYDAGRSLDVAATRSCLVRYEGLLVFDAANGKPGDLRVLVGRVGTADRDSESLLGAISKPIVGDLGDEPLVRDAFARILSELDRPNFGSAALTAALMKLCLILFARRYRGEMIASAQMQTGLDPRLAAAVGSIIARPDAPYNVNTLADLAGMSRSTFARHFSDAIGIGPMEFVLRTRLRHASTLLKETGLSIKQVAAASGFLSRSHFSRAFRSDFGVDPSSFRAGDAAGQQPATDA